MNGILFVVNPVSGGTAKAAPKTLIEQWCSQQEVVYQLFETTGKEDAARLAERIEQAQPAIVVACGGDGTLNLVARQLLGTSMTLGILPLGSANGLATDLRIPENVGAALDVLSTGHTLNLDVLLINERHHCLHLSDIGYNARLIQEFESDTERGKRGYLKSFFRVARERPLARFRIQLGEHRYVRRGVMATFANARRYGTGAIVNPFGQLDDGQFETCIFMPWPRWYLLWMSILFFIGRVDKSKYVKILSGDQVRVDADRPLPLQVDGELVGDVQSVVVRILPEKVKVLIPNESQRGLPFDQSPQSG
ncbi:MAG: diacylglycerol kinase family lipid kinase [Phaeodactylibacter sp.]|uniref:diacylglycerol/lipid kinase family protein n=1 Tax=Phaeodactylibacter sp. TaxID=1940289 RepID=UPI0032F038E9